MNDETKSAIRVALLEAQANYLEEAAKATTVVESALANVIATSFEREAAKYKTPDPERVGVNVAAYDKFVSGDQS